MKSTYNNPSQDGKIRLNEKLFIGLISVLTPAVILSLSVLLTACGDDAGSADASTDGAVHDGYVNDSKTDDGGAEDSGENDGGPCHHQGVLGDPCTDDCDCGLDTPCRGYPGKKECSIPCINYSDCDNSPMECDLSATCDHNIGGCRCLCTEANCPDGVCFGGHCVGCAIDEDCAQLECEDDPILKKGRCRPDTQECVCGGSCGDGVCDEYEEVTNTCPEDCPGPCINGETLPFSCQSGKTIEWCRCEEESWVCQDPYQHCEGDNSCEQKGGQCVDSADHCYEGEIAGDPQGCSGDNPFCCQSSSCFGVGMTYYPTLGHCCPGLRALPAIQLMEGMMPDVDGVLCFSTCWSQTCSTCGDSICQPHYSENFCTCPEDCPPPPDGLVCTSSPMECGITYCSQEGDICEQYIPGCDEESCSWTVESNQGQTCDNIERRCVSL